MSDFAADIVGKDAEGERDFHSPWSVRLVQSDEGRRHKKRGYWLLASLTFSAALLLEGWFLTGSAEGQHLLSNLTSRAGQPQV